MAYTTLIQTEQLASILGDPDWAIVDCRFYLAEPGRGKSEYLEGHIPGAVYAHLDQDLCGPIIPGSTGRHPLPTVEIASEILSGWGIDPRVQVVAYDDAGGSMAAARLWWMLRWLGHPAVAVLDGGWRNWKRERHLVKTGSESRTRRNFIPQINAGLRSSAEEILARKGQLGFLLIDVRNPDRFQGENETIDPVAGHIPGAVNLPYTKNLDARNRFLPPEALSELYMDILGDTAPEEAVFYCGSGVTAAHSLLALAHAGLGNARLYDGSWSDWITDGSHPVEK